MKKFVRVLAFSCAVACNAASAQEFSDDVDRFTGEHKVTYRGQASPGGNRPAVVVGGIEDKGKTEAFLMFAFTSYSSRYSGSSWRYLNCHNVNWVVDKQPVALADAKHDGRVQRGGVLEFISVKLTSQDLAKLAAGSYVEYRVCNDEFALLPEDLEGLKRVAASLRVSLDPPPSPPKGEDGPVPKVETPAKTAKQHKGK